MCTKYREGGKIKTRVEGSMKNIVIITLFVGVLFAGFLSTACTSDPQRDLQEIFNDCPEQAKSWIYWYWMDGNISKKGITNDLEEMKRAGMGGTHIFNVACKLPAGPVNFMSQEWMDLTLFAIEEADRLGLQIGMHNCPGWSASGGPWIKPENAMKKILFLEHFTDGGKKIEVDLPVPTNQDFYEDIKVLAFPALKDEGFRFTSWQEKTGKVARITSALPPIDVVDVGNIIDFETIIDISRYMDASGHLSWDAPEGNWTIVRFGYTYINGKNRFAPVEGTGLECDKFDTVAVKAHFDAYPRKIIEMARPYVGKTFNVIAIDSYEGGIQTWTEAFMREFMERREYDMTAWLPCLTGRVVGSPELTDRFLCDYRLTISDLYRDYYYGYMRKLVADYDMKLFVEPYGDHNTNPMDIGSQSDINVFEFWLGRTNPVWAVYIKTVASTVHVYDRKIVDAEAFTSLPEDVWQTAPCDLKPYADRAYVQGLNRFNLHVYSHQPRSDIKPGMSMGPFGSFFTCNNTWWEPGAAMFRYFTRCNAMLQEGLYVADILSYMGNIAPWTEEMSESGYEDLNYYNGYSFDYCNTDVILNRISIKNGRITLPGGMTYRLLLLPKSKSIDMNVLQKIQTLVKEGMIVVGERPEISQGLKGYPECDARVKSIALQLWGNDNTSSGVHSYGKGKVFWGKTPEQVLQELSIAPDFVCNAPDSSSVDVHFTHRRNGDTDIYFLANNNDKAGKVECFFRTKDKLPELWDPHTGEIKTLAIYSRSKDGVTIPLYFDRYGSMFIVFRKRDKDFDPVEDIIFNGRSVAVQGMLLMPDIYVDEVGVLKIDAFEAGNYVVTETSGAQRQFVVDQTDNIIDISDEWDVWFDPAMGGVGDVSFKKIKSWSVHPHPEIKYYSGTAIYRKNFDIPETMLGGRIYLSFDRIADLGRVVINDVECAILWTPPYRVDITKYVKAGSNTIEVGVTNSWNNRLVGDERYPENHNFAEYPEWEWAKGTYRIMDIPDWYTNNQPKPDSKRVTFVTWKACVSDSTLYDAGIIGSVKITAQLNQ